MTVKDIDKFRDALAEHAGRPTRFGHYDCVSFVAGVLKDGMNLDLQPYPYFDRGSAIATIRILGGFEQAVSSALGEPCDPADLVDGDVVMVQGMAGRIVGIMVNDVVVVKAPHGVHQLQKEAIIKAWKVPHCDS